MQLMSSSTATTSPSSISTKAGPISRPRGNRWKWLVDHLSCIPAAFVFYGLIMPVGSLLRLFRQDTLFLRPRRVSSYWIAMPPKPGRQSYFRQY
jgi:hypothetical protein